MRSWFGLAVFVIALLAWWGVRQAPGVSQSAEAETVSAGNSRGSVAATGARAGAVSPTETETEDSGFSLGSAAADAVAAPATDSVAPLAQLRGIENCLEETNPCGLADTYPRQLEDQVSARAVQTLRSLRSAGVDARDGAEIAHWALRFPEEKVRLEGLEWAVRYLAPRERALTVIASLTDASAIPLYDRGLEILKAVQKAAPAEIDAFLEATLRTGGHFPMNVVAREAGGFLNASNVARFERVLKSLPPSSEAAMNLRSNLDDYRLRHSGG